MILDQAEMLKLSVSDPNMSDDPGQFQLLLFIYIYSKHNFKYHFLT